MTGYSDRELTDGSICPIESLILADDRPHVCNAIMQALQTGRPFTLEYRARHKNGGIRYLMEKGTPVYGPDKRPVYIDGVILDITAQKQAQGELRKYRDHLEELVVKRTTELQVLNDQLRQSQKMEAIGLLAGGIAHDFNNILTTIKGSMHLIDRHLDKNSPLMKYVEQALSSVDKANNLSQSLLAFSRKQTIALQFVDFNEIIRNVAGLMSQLIGEHIELTMDLSDRTPVVLADVNQMEQVLVNLVTNSRDAMPGGGKLAIRTEIIRMDEVFMKERGYGTLGQYVLLTLSDTGTGMKEEVKVKIFEPFFTTKELGVGSGLGLAVTYGIVKQHNGYIDVETSIGQGTTFRIYIPLASTAVKPAKIPSEFRARGGGETILLAEDDVDTRDIMSEVLRLSGYRVIEAKDGEDAIRLFKEDGGMADLVFLDVRMPRKNSREVYEEIRKTSPQTPVLFMSGYTEDIIDDRGIIAEGLNLYRRPRRPSKCLKRYGKCWTGKDLMKDSDNPLPGWERALKASSAFKLPAD